MKIFQPLVAMPYRAFSSTSSASSSSSSFQQFQKAFRQKKQRQKFQNTWQQEDNAQQSTEKQQGERSRTHYTFQDHETYKRYSQRLHASRHWQLEPQIKSDLLLMGLGEETTLTKAKQKYFELAKIHHPDAVREMLSKKHQQSQRHLKAAGDKFTKLQEAYSRVTDWIERREHFYNEKIEKEFGTVQHHSDGRVEFTVQSEAGQMQEFVIPRDQLILHLAVEQEEYEVKEPRNLLRYLKVGWGVLGVWFLSGDVKEWARRQMEVVREAREEV